MSDSCMYELEDIVWEELGDNDDHIVPHTVGKKNGYGVESDSSKRPRYELTSTENNVDNKNASNNVVQRQEEICPVKQEKEIMLEKSPWPQPSGGAVSASLGGDPNRKALLSVSDEAMTSNQCMKDTDMDSTACGLRGDDLTLGDQNPSVDNSLCQYQLNNADQMENDLGFLGSDLQDKENGDLLYYTWPELENFEDVDSMFRNCDSTFGLGLDNDDELGWFSSSQAAEESEDALKSSFNISASDLRGINSVTEHPEVYEHNNAGLIVHDVDKKPNSVSCKSNAEKGTYNDSSIAMNSSYSDGSGAVPSIRGDLQVRSYVSKSSRNEKPSEGNGKEQSIHFGSLKQESEADQSLNFQSSLWAETQQQGVVPQACLQTHLPLINSNTIHLSDQVLARPGSSKIKSEDSRLPSLSPRESSHASNHMLSAESPHDVTFQQPAILQNTKKEKLRLSRGSDKRNLIVPRVDSDPISMQKQVPIFENEVDGQSEVNGSDVGFTGELDSSNIQESSCMSSLLEEVSIEASSFRQLQHVLEQLDIRTKLCIRDSLYRLARSAEQRHECVNLTSISRGNKDPGDTPISDETTKSPEFMDIETDTNPIDRSIAHLLFHRPSDPSATAGLDPVPVKPHSMVQARSTGPVMGEKFSFQEETTSANMETLKNECENCDN